MVQIYCGVYSKQFNKTKPKAFRFSSVVNTQHILCRAEPLAVGRTVVHRLGVGNKIIKHVSC